jgi:hypothetical protein
MHNNGIPLSVTYFKNRYKCTPEDFQYYSQKYDLGKTYSVLCSIEATPFVKEDEIIPQEVSMTVVSTRNTNSVGRICVLTVLFDHR